MTNAIKVTVLPYMGKPSYPKPARVSQPMEVPFTQLHAYELEQVEAKINQFDDPYVVLTRKVAHLAELLGCDEAQAERILLDRIGS